MLRNIPNPGKNFFAPGPETMTLHDIKASEYVVFDLHTTGDFEIELSDGSRHASNLFSITAEDRAALIRACLQDNIVIGFNLAFTFAWCACLTDFHVPACALDISALCRSLSVDPAQIEGLSALEAVYVISEKNNFDDAYAEIHALDAERDGAFFNAVEMIPYGLRNIIGSSIRDALNNDGEADLFKASASRDRNDNYVIEGADGKHAMSFHQRFFSIVESEIEIELETAVENICALLGE